MVFFESHQITIIRNRRVGSAHRFTMSATFTAHAGDIQPASVERTEMAQGRFGSVFTGFVDTSVRIKEGDQIISNGKKYSVKGVVTWQGAGLLDHNELTLVSQDGNDG